MYRALQAQHRLRVLSVLNSITQQPVNVAHLTTLDDEAIKATVEHYVQALYSELPPLQMVEVSCHHNNYPCPHY